MFNRKANQIKELKSTVSEITKQNYSTQIEQIEDFELILKQIKDLANEKGQWTHTKKTINNAIDLALENYKEKRIDLVIDSEM